MTQHREFAKSAAAETAPRDSVGPFIDAVDEGDSVYTYRFECKLKGYRDWRWTVVIFAPDNQQPTVSEVLLMPGEGSLIAPDWVPWSERLADYRALQAELEAQAAQRAALCQTRRDAAELIRLALDRPGHAEWTFDERRAVLEIVGVRVEIDRPHWQIHLLQF